ncbi:MAG: hypothetical protein MJA29_07020, partial [Candidatus Omnitrophica bacterium]|nr:hypothetical protein [Candidatus Omnitrophota bacterium]
MMNKITTRVSVNTFCPGLSSDPLSYIDPVLNTSIADVIRLGSKKNVYWSFITHGGKLGQETATENTLKMMPDYVELTLSFHVFHKPVRDYILDKMDKEERGLSDWEEESRRKRKKLVERYAKNFAPVIEAIFSRNGKFPSRGLFRFHDLFGRSGLGKHISNPRVCNVLREIQSFQFEVVYSAMQKILPQERLERLESDIEKVSIPTEFIGKAAQTLISLGAKREELETYLRNKEDLLMFSLDPMPAPYLIALGHDGRLMLYLFEKREVRFRMGQELFPEGAESIVFSAYLEVMRRAVFDEPLSLTELREIYEEKIGTPVGHLVEKVSSAEYRFSQKRIPFNFSQYIKLLLLFFLDEGQVKELLNRVEKDEAARNELWEILKDIPLPTHAELRASDKVGDEWLGYISRSLIFKDHPALKRDIVNYVKPYVLPQRAFGSVSTADNGRSSSPVTPVVSENIPKTYPIIKKGDIFTGETWARLVQETLDEPAFIPEKLGLYTALALTMEDVLSGYEPWLKLSDDRISSIRSRVKELAGKVSSMDFIWSDEYYQELKNLLSHVPTIENPHTELFVDVFEGFTPRQMGYVLDKYLRGDIDLRVDLNKSCFHNCRHCFASLGKGRESFLRKKEGLRAMPYPLAIKVLESIASDSQRPYFRSDFFGYIDPVLNATIADIYWKAEKGHWWSELALLTHGGDEKHPERTEYILSRLPSQTMIYLSLHMLHDPILNYIRDKMQNKSLGKGGSRKALVEEKKRLIHLYANKFIPVIKHELSKDGMREAEDQSRIFYYDLSDFIYPPGVAKNKLIINFIKELQDFESRLKKEITDALPCDMKLDFGKVLANAIEAKVKPVGETTEFLTGLGVTHEWIERFIGSMEAKILDSYDPLLFFYYFILKYDGSLVLETVEKREVRFRTGAELFTEGPESSAFSVYLEVFRQCVFGGVITRDSVKRIFSNAGMDPKTSEVIVSTERDSGAFRVCRYIDMLLVFFLNAERTRDLLGRYDSDATARRELWVALQNVPLPTHVEFPVYNDDEGLFGYISQSLVFSGHPALKRDIVHYVRSFLLPQRAFASMPATDRNRSSSPVTPAVSEASPRVGNQEEYICWLMKQKGRKKHGILKTIDKLYRNDQLTILQAAFLSLIVEIKDRYEFFRPGTRYYQRFFTKLNQQDKGTFRAAVRECALRYPERLLVRALWEGFFEKEHLSLVPRYSSLSDSEKEILERLSTYSSFHGTSENKKSNISHGALLKSTAPLFNKLLSRDDFILEIRKWFIKLGEEIESLMQTEKESVTDGRPWLDRVNDWVFRKWDELLGFIKRSRESIADIKIRKTVLRVLWLYRDRLNGIFKHISPEDIRDCLDKFKGHLDKEMPFQKTFIPGSTIAQMRGEIPVAILADFLEIIPGGFHALHTLRQAYGKNRNSSMRVVQEEKDYPMVIDRYGVLRWLEGVLADLPGIIEDPDREWIHRRYKEAKDYAATFGSLSDAGQSHIELTVMIVDKLGYIPCGSKENMRVKLQSFQSALIKKITRLDSDIATADNTVASSSSKNNASSSAVRQKNAQKKSEVVCFVVGSGMQMWPLAAELLQVDTSPLAELVSIIRALTRNFSIDIQTCAVHDESMEGGEKIRIKLFEIPVLREDVEVVLRYPSQREQVFSSLRLNKALTGILQFVLEHKDRPVVVLMEAAFEKALSEDTLKLFRELREQKVVLIAGSGPDADLSDVILVKKHDKKYFSINYPARKLFGKRLPRGMDVLVSGKVRLVLSPEHRQIIDELMSRPLYSLGLESLSGSYGDLTPVTPLGEAVDFDSLSSYCRCGPCMSSMMDMYSSFLNNPNLLNESRFLRFFSSQIPVIHYVDSDYAAAKASADILVLLHDAGKRLSYKSIQYLLREGASSYPYASGRPPYLDLKTPDISWSSSSSAVGQEHFWRSLNDNYILSFNDSPVCPLAEGYFLRSFLKSDFEESDIIPPAIYTPQGDFFGRAYDWEPVYGSLRIVSKSVHGLSGARTSLLLPGLLQGADYGSQAYFCFYVKSIAAQQMVSLKLHIAAPLGGLVLFRPWKNKDILSLVLEYLQDKDHRISIESASRAWRETVAPERPSRPSVFTDPNLLFELLLFLEEKGLLKNEGFSNIIKHSLNPDTLVSFEEGTGISSDLMGDRGKVVRILEEYNILKPSSSSAVAGEVGSQKKSKVVCCVLDSGIQMWRLASNILQVDTSPLAEMVSIIKKRFAGFPVDIRCYEVNDEGGEIDQEITIKLFTIPLLKEDVSAVLQHPVQRNEVFSPSRLNTALADILQFARENRDTPVVVLMGAAFEKALPKDTLKLFRKLRKENVVLIAGSDSNTDSSDVILIKNREGNLFSINYPTRKFFGIKTSGGLDVLASGEMKLVPSLENQRKIAEFLSRNIRTLGVEPLFKRYQDLTPLTPLGDAIDFDSLSRFPRGGLLIQNAGRDTWFLDEVRFLNECRLLRMFSQKHVLNYSHSDYAAARVSADIIVLLSRTGKRLSYKSIQERLKKEASYYYAFGPRPPYIALKIPHISWPSSSSPVRREEGNAGVSSSPVAPAVSEPELEQLWHAQISWLEHLALVLNDNQLEEFSGLIDKAVERGFFNKDKNLSRVKALKLALKYFHGRTKKLLLKQKLYLKIGTEFGVGEDQVRRLLTGDVTVVNGFSGVYADLYEGINQDLRARLFQKLVSVLSQKINSFKIFKEFLEDPGVQDAVAKNIQRLEFTLTQTRILQCFMENKVNSPKKLSEKAATSLTNLPMQLRECAKKLSPVLKTQMGRRAIVSIAERRRSELFKYLAGHLNEFREALDGVIKDTVKTPREIDLTESEKIELIQMHLYQGMTFRALGAHYEKDESQVNRFFNGKPDRASLEGAIPIMQRFLSQELEKRADHITLRLVSEESSGEKWIAAFDRIVYWHTIYQVPFSWMYFALKTSDRAVAFVSEESPSRETVTELMRTSHDLTFFGPADMLDNLWVTEIDRQAVERWRQWSLDKNHEGEWMVVRLCRRGLIWIMLPESGYRAN